MRGLSAHEMLSVWERGRSAALTDRALLLLAHACPDLSLEALSELPIGERDTRLLTLREWAFGSDLSSVARCPECGERLELNFTVADVRAVRLPDTTGGPLSIESGGYEVVFRLPSSSDFTALEGREDARDLLLERCVESARRNGRRRSAKQLPRAVIADIVDRMAEADPQADVHTVLDCPACSHSWRVVFDIVSYFWAEIESWAHRMMRDIHLLASAYGWREADILALSPWRRQCYLQMVQR